MPQFRAPIRVDLGHHELRLDHGALASALADLPIVAPVVALIHGYSFMPDLPGQCPHQHILSLSPSILDRRVISWPRHLHLDGHRGLALACGWSARGSIWHVHRRAALAGRALAELATLVAQMSPGRHVDVLCHSMGARVRSQAKTARLRRPGTSQSGLAPCRIQAQTAKQPAISAKAAPM